MVRFGVLGPLEVRSCGRVLATGGPRQRAVLARLVIEPRCVVSVDALVDAVWGEDPPVTSVKTLQKYVAELRKVLGPDLVDTRGRGYVLEVADDDIDARQFETLGRDAHRAAMAGDTERAVVLLERGEALWRGDVLADFADAAFVAGERSRLTELRWAARELLLDSQLALGRVADVVVGAAGLVELLPLREAPWSAMMLALYRSGRHAEALRVAERYRRMLVEELGLEPSTEMRDLVGRILRQDPELAHPAAASSLGAVGSVQRPHTRLVGRSAEIAAVEAAVEAHRMVTLVGTGGVGKTRLAAEVGLGFVAGWTGGCWFVDLTSADGGDLVARSIADAVSVTDQAGEPLIDSLVAAVSHRGRVVILLDNCEHVRDACAAIAIEILSRTGNVHLLATSRHRLGIEDEYVIPVHPLAINDGGGRSPAVELFVARAAAASPGLDLSTDDLDVIRTICSRLDGLPLAIELAASQTRVLDPADIAERLDRRLSFRGSAGPQPFRHRTLDAAITWSYELLSGPARALFDHLAVFAGTCTFEAIEAVAPDQAQDDVLGAVTELVDASMLVRERGLLSRTRFRLLDTLRLYGLQRLEQSGHAALARRAHASYFADLARTAAPNLFGPDEATWIQRLRADEANIRAAVAWASDADPDLAAQLCIALRPYWSHMWRNAEGVALLEPMLDEADGGRLDPELRAGVLTAAACLASETGEAPSSVAWAHEASNWFAASGDERRTLEARYALGTALGNHGALDEAEAVLADVVAAAHRSDPILRAQALEAWGLVAGRRGAHEEARRRYLDELDAWAELGSQTGQATAMLLLAQTLRTIGDLDGATELSDRAIKAYRAVGNLTAAAHTLSTLADVARVRGDAAGAERIYREAMTAFQANGDRRCLASTAKNLGVLASARGDHTAAAALLLESLRLRRALGDEAGLAECAEGLATVALATGRVAAAATLLSAGAATRDRTGSPVLPDDDPFVDTVRSRVAQLLDKDAYAEASTAGAGLLPEELVAYAASLWPSAAADRLLDG